MYFRPTDRLAHDRLHVVLLVPLVPLVLLVPLVPLVAMLVVSMPLVSMPLVAMPPVMPPVMPPGVSLGTHMLLAGFDVPAGALACCSQSTFHSFFHAPVAFFARPSLLLDFLVACNRTKSDDSLAFTQASRPLHVSTVSANAFAGIQR